MKKTFVDVMLELPVDATLRDFLTTHSLPVPDGFAWDDTPETSQLLVEAVKVWPDIAARDRMTANLMASVQLGDGAGKQAMFEAAVADGAALAGLALCASDIHRSFWLYVHHPALFERAYDFSFWEQHGQQTQQYDLGLKRQAGARGSTGGLRSTRRHAATCRLVFHALRGGSVGVTDCCSKQARQRMAMARAQIMVAKGHVRVPRRRS